MKIGLKIFFLIILSFPFLVSAEINHHECSPMALKTLQKEVMESFERHNYKKVIQTCREFITAYPDTFVPFIVRVLYSQSLVDTGQIKEGIKILDALISEMTPQANRLVLQYDLANLLFLQKRYVEAERVYRKIELKSEHYHQILNKTKERLALLRQRDSKKKDFATLQLLDLETLLEAGDIPGEAEPILQNILEQDLEAEIKDRAKNLLRRVRSLRIKKAKALLDEARRIFDEEKRYIEVKNILEEIQRNYDDVSDRRSVEVLLDEVNKRLR